MPLPFAISIHFGGPFSVWPWWATLISIVSVFSLAFVLLVLLYRAESKLVSRSTSRWLILLRFATIVCILVALLFDPVAIRKTMETVPGVVVVAVDRSDSMRITEAHRPLAEKLNLAERLKLFDGITSAAVVRDWRMSVERGSTPKFAGPNDPEKNAFAGVIAKVDSMTRLSATKKILSPDGLDLLARLRGVHSLDLVGFGSDLVTISPDLSTLSETLHSDSTSTLTDLSLPLARAVELGSTVVGVVLFTDGRHTWGESPNARLADLAARGIPVYPIVTASATPPADVAILSAQAQANTVFKGSVVPVEVQVRVTGWPSGLVRVNLKAPNGNPVQATFGHNGTDATYAVTLKVKLDEAGPQPLVVSAEGEGATDSIPANNQRTCRVTVVKDRAKVLIVDSEARWEFHYLHTCLGRDPNMDVRSIVFRQPRLGLVSESELKTVGTPALAMPADLDALSSYDCVILGDIELQQLTPEWRKRIETYVSESGGTLVLVAGKRAMPKEYTTLTNDPIRRLLPISDSIVSEVENGFPISITNNGQRAWFLSLADTPAASNAQWGNFPPHYWATVGTAKPGAEVLATVPGPDGKPASAFVRQNYGFGRVLYLGIDSTWRWRYKAGDLYHHRFWGQVVQWAASDRLLPAVNAAGTIRFGPREPSIRGGSEVEVAVRISDEVKIPSGIKAATVIRIPDQKGDAEKIVAAVPLQIPDGRPRELSAKVRSLPPGRYAVELNVPEWSNDLHGSPNPNGQPTPLRALLDIVPPDDSELIDLTPDRDWLQRAASLTGGKVHTIDTLDELVESLTAKAANRETTIEHPWRRSWWLLGLVVALLGIEWAIRKWVGLA